MGTLVLMHVARGYFPFYHTLWQTSWWPNSTSTLVKSFLAVQNSSIGLIVRSSDRNWRTFTFYIQRVTLETRSQLSLNFLSAVSQLFLSFFQLVTCDIWDADYNTDNWEPGIMTIVVTWHWTVFAILAMFLTVQVIWNLTLSGNLLPMTAIWGTPSHCCC